MGFGPVRGGGPPQGPVEPPSARENANVGITKRERTSETAGWSSLVRSGQRAPPRIPSRALRLEFLRMVVQYFTVVFLFLPVQHTRAGAHGPMTIDDRLG